jgi:hypothetical protein
MLIFKTMTSWRAAGVLRTHINPNAQSIEDNLNSIDGSPSLIFPAEILT